MTVCSKSCGSLLRNIGILSWKQPLRSVPWPHRRAEPRIKAAFQGNRSSLWPSWSTDTHLTCFAAPSAPAHRPALHIHTPIMTKNVIYLTCWLVVTLHNPSLCVFIGNGLPLYAWWPLHDDRTGSKGVLTFESTCVVLSSKQLDSSSVTLLWIL